MSEKKDDMLPQIRIPGRLREDLENMAMEDERKLADFVRHNLKAMAVAWRLKRGESMDSIHDSYRADKK